MMNKRFLGIITSVSLIASSLTFGAGAAPSPVVTYDTAQEYFPAPEQFVETENTETQGEFTSIGPSAVTVTDTAAELNTEFGAPVLFEGASLMSGFTGEGTEQSPYLVGTADELFLAANYVNTGVDNSAHYKLVSDIDLEGAEWTPIGHYNTTDKYGISFSGVFDGNGHTVSNFKMTNDNTSYIGFFGHVSGGVIKNLTVKDVTVDIDSESKQRLYVSPFIGRIVANTNGCTVSVENCNVLSSSVKAVSNGTIYAGGIAGSIVAEKNMYAKVFLTLTNSECDFDVVTNAQYKIEILGEDGKSKTYDYQLVSVGGITGYLYSQITCEISVSNCSAKGNISTEASYKDESISSTMSGGVFGDIRNIDEKTGDSGVLNISSCYSEGTLSTVSGFRPYVTGGFAGQVYSGKGVSISDCYSSCDVYGFYHNAGYIKTDSNNIVIENLDPTAGGFAGQFFFYRYITSYGKTTRNCYASGDVVDLGYNEETPPDYSFVGGFTGWSDAGIFENCVRFEAQTVKGSDVFDNKHTIKGLSLLSDEESKHPDNYVGFDMTSVWTMDPEAEYFYPTLREKMGYVKLISDGELFATIVFGENGRVPNPAKTPVKAPSSDTEYTFNYWSLSEDGEAFNFGSDTLSESTVLYAVYTATPRKYSISFISDGEQFGSVQRLVYGALIKEPLDIPKKEDTKEYLYDFLYWSDSPNGEEYVFDHNSTVTGDKTFYAVFEEIDKSAWDGTVADSFESGFGTEALPYIISTAKEFALFREVINEARAGYTDAYYALGNNINLGNRVWEPIGDSINNPFSGHFDGRGYSISNFQIASGQYAALFGVVVNAEIKNLHIFNFKCKFINTEKVELIDDTKAYHTFASALAGYVKAQKGDVEISGIRVSDGEFDVEATSDYLHIGNIAGHVNSYSRGNVIISNCFSTSDVTGTNNSKNGYVVAGGIAGRVTVGPFCDALITKCYNTGKVSATATVTSTAGGIAGYFFYHGPYISAGGQYELPNLFAEDIDSGIMMLDCFAVAEVYSSAKELFSYGGRLVGECSQHAVAENSYYPSNVNIPLEVVASKPEYIKYNSNDGDGIPLSYFTNEELLAEKCGFDFENTWVFITGHKYPMLKCMVMDKPTLELISSAFIGDSVKATLHVVSPEENFTLVISVYNKRNQLVDFIREIYENTDTMIEYTYENEELKTADRMTVSVVETASLMPLFEALELDI